MYGFPAPTAPAWMTASAIGGAVVIKIVDWWLSRRRNHAEGELALTGLAGGTALIEALKERIDALEARQAVLEHRLAEEIQLRLDAHQEVARLRIRAMQLEALLRAHRIPVPEDFTTKPAPTEPPHAD